MPNANASPKHIEVSTTLRPSRRRAVGRAALLAAALGAVGFALASAKVPCGFARMLHVPCPGCGSTRAMLALASGDLQGLLRFNPLAPFMTALVVLLALQALLSVFTTGTFRGVGDGKLGALVARGMLVIAALEVLVWFARFGGFLGGPVPV